MPTNPSVTMENSPPTFEIKIGLIGDVHVDKTFVLRALLCEKFREISILNTSNVNEIAISGPTQWELVVEDDELPSESNSKEIQDEACASYKVTAQRLEVELDEPLFEMRKDTKLVLVDIPGFDQADTNYKNYLETHWNTFDCIVVVVDWRQGVKNQASLLEIVKKNAESQRDIPGVVVSRKVDDGTDQLKFIAQVQQLVEKIFGVSDLHENLDEILDRYDMLQEDEALQTLSLEDEQPQRSWQTASPVVLPESGCYDGSLLKVLSFLVGGMDNQTRIIEERIQSQLSAITFDPNFVKKLEILHNRLVSLSGNPESFKTDVRPAFWQLCTALEQSYFDSPNCTKAPDVFARIVDASTEYKRFATEKGWETEAARVVAAARSSCYRFFASMNWHFGFVFDLKLMYNKLKEVSPDAIDSSATKKALNETFHRLIGDLWRQTIVVVATLPDTLKFLSALVDEITQYGKFVKEADMEYVRSYIEDTFGFFLRYHLQGLCQKASDGLYSYSYMDPNTPKNSFASLNPVDWKRVFRSILLLRYDRRFCETFGNEIVWMEHLIDQANAAIVPDVTGHAGLKPVGHNQEQLLCMKLTQKGNQLVPSNGFNLSQTVIEIPQSFSDPNHFAHIAWRYCEFMEGKTV